MFTEHLDSLEYYSDTWVDAIEKQQKIYVHLQNLICITKDFDMQLHNMLSELKNRPAEEVILSEVEYWETQGSGVTEALLWSERGRARFLEQQLDQREQLLPEGFLESRNKDLSAFYSDDQVSMTRKKYRMLDSNREFSKSLICKITEFAGHVVSFVESPFLVSIGFAPFSG